MTKSKGMVFDSTPGNGGVHIEDAKARLKLQTLMRNYQELHKEVDAMKKKLGAANKTKVVVAAEVRFLRKRYQCLANPSSQSMLLSRKLLSRPDKMRGLLVRHGAAGKEACLSNPPSKKVAQGRKKGSQLGLKGVKSKVGVETKRKAGKQSGKQDINASGITLSDCDFDTNHCSTEDLLPSRAPLFDLNQVSVGDEDIQHSFEPVSNMEVDRSLTNATDDNLQNDLKLIVCRNAGEGSSSSRVAKRKISWQDPVAVRV